MRSDGLEPAQVDGLEDLDAAAYRRALHEVADLIADYAESLPDRPVLPPVEPGSIAPLFPASPPEDPESLDTILADYRRLVEPHATAWNHPGFMAYFPTSSSAAGVIGELLMASLAQNTFLWGPRRSGPSSRPLSCRGSGRRSACPRASMASSPTRHRSAR